MAEQTSDVYILVAMEPHRKFPRYSKKKAFLWFMFQALEDLQVLDQQSAEVTIRVTSLKLQEFKYTIAAVINNVRVDIGFDWVENHGDHCHLALRDIAGESLSAQVRELTKSWISYLRAEGVVQNHGSSRGDKLKSCIGHRFVPGFMSRMWSPFLFPFSYPTRD